MTRIEALMYKDEIGILTPEDIKVLDRHYAQVFQSTAFLHTSATANTGT